ncbi:carboxypeptidase regulatory-like domain-containing protein [Isosphaeraceae bacterium EP7]
MNDRLAALWPLLACTLLAGCEMGSADSARPRSPKRVPTSGVVTLDGKPLAGAVVTFLPIDEEGSLTVSDVREGGHYDLTYVTFPGGTAPGKYKVAVSYLIGTDGRPVDLGTRSALQVPKEAIEAKERLPKKYSDLGVTTLVAVVPPAGGTFDFPLEGPLLPGPDVKLGDADLESEQPPPDRPGLADPNLPPSTEPK